VREERTLTFLLGFGSRHLESRQGSSKIGSSSVCRVGEPIFLRPVEW
jgi:hypothetical protein